MVQYCLLRDGEQSVEIALLRHESIESAVPNWADVVGVYAIKVGADAETPSDVTEMSPENAECNHAQLMSKRAYTSKHPGKARII